MSESELNGYSRLSMAEFKGAVGAKIEAIESDISEIKSSCKAHNDTLNDIKQDLAVLMSSGSGLAKETEERVEKIEQRVVTLEDHEKGRVVRANKMAAIFGAVGGAILSFISHFVTTWISRPK